MKNLCLSAIFACSALLALAQEQTKDTYRVKNGTVVSQIIPFNERFQDTLFMDGVVYFRNGRTSKARLNYSLVHGEIMFISPTRDTLLLNDNDYISRIFVGDKSYRFKKGHGHVQIIGDYGRASLGKKIFLVRAGNERHAAYNQYSETSAIDTYSSFINQNGDFQFLQGSDKVILRRRELYFLVDHNEDFHYVSRSSLARVFPGHRRQIDEFIKSKNFDLEKEDDLREVLAFCSNLRR